MLAMETFGNKKQEREAEVQFTVRKDSAKTMVEVINDRKEVLEKNEAKDRHHAKIIGIKGVGDQFDALLAAGSRA